MHRRPLERRRAPALESLDIMCQASCRVTSSSNLTHNDLERRRSLQNRARRRTCVKLQFPETKAGADVADRTVVPHVPTKESIDKPCVIAVGRGRARRVRSADG